jgi:hypothetical protein
MRIEPTQAAVNQLLHVRRDNRGGTLRIIGTLGAETVPLEQPTQLAPDVDNDSHWTSIMSGGAAYTLDAGNNARGVPYTGLMRIKKPLSTGNAFGVEYA